MREELFELENRETRIRVIGEVIHNLFNCAFSGVSSEYYGKTDTMNDWFLAYYDLTSGLLWEISTTIEEQCDKIDELISKIERSVENGKTEEDQ